MSRQDCASLENQTELEEAAGIICQGNLLKAGLRIKKNLQRDINSLQDY